jgi:hypothetical protein
VVGAGTHQLRCRYTEEETKKNIPVSDEVEAEARMRKYKWSDMRREEHQKKSIPEAEAIEGSMTST